MNHHTDVRFLQKEARAVDGLVTALADLGITCPEFLADAIEGETNLHEIVGNLIQADGELAAQIEALADYKKKIDERLKRMKAAKETLRERLHEALKLSQKERIATAFGTLHYTRGQPEAEVAHEVDLPTIYFKREVDKSLVSAHAKDFYKGLEALKATKTDEDFEALLAEMKLSPYHENWYRMYRETSQIEDEEDRAELLGIFEAENPPIPGVIIKPPVQSISIRRN